MKVLKFGGTSVGTVANLKKVCELVNDGQTKIVVLSAMSGTTNALVQITDLLQRAKSTDASVLIYSLHKQYIDIVDELYTSDKHKIAMLEKLNFHFDQLNVFAQQKYQSRFETEILAIGEQLSVALFFHYLQEMEIPSESLYAPDFIRLQQNNEPDHYYIKENLTRLLNQSATVHNNTLYITQGFICKDQNGWISNLQRGGSDYTASLIGAAIAAEEIQIWTDIDGMHNNDPRYVERTFSLSHLSFDEAAELAYFGAKILHPSSIRPARMAGIPVRIKNTNQPDAEGTYISDRTLEKSIKAVAAKDDITVIRIRSGRMLMAYGFLSKLFAVFEKYQTSIDMITTSEVSVSVSIDQADNLEAITAELSALGQLEITYDHSIVCIVGDLIAESKGRAVQVLDAVKHIPIKMISYGSSNNNISLLIDSQDKSEALNALSQHLFQEQHEPAFLRHI